MDSQNSLLVFSDFDNFHLGIVIKNYYEKHFFRNEIRF